MSFWLEKYEVKIDDIFNVFIPAFTSQNSNLNSFVLENLYHNQGGEKREVGHSTGNVQIPISDFSEFQLTEKIKIVT